MAPESHGAARELRRLGTGRFVRVDEREMEGAAREVVAEVLLDTADGRRGVHRNATTKNAKRATVIATLLIVCSKWRRSGRCQTETPKIASAAPTRTT